MAAEAAKAPERVFKNHANTQEEEDAYDFVQHRTNVKFTSVTGSVAHIVKGALGAGILSTHVAYKKAGYMVAIPLNIIFGIYFGYCLHLLVKSAQILYKRTRVPLMSYPDVGEASASLFPNPKVQRLAKPFRYTIDAIICIDLFGCCTTYQIIIAKTIKQLVENSHETSFEGQFGYPHLRVYLACLIPIVIVICLIRHLKYLAPFSLVANVFILMCIFTSGYYAFAYNPSFKSLETHSTFYSTFEFIGMTVFSMSCAGVVIPIENNMREPHKFPQALFISFVIVVAGLVCASFFGYVAFLEKSEAPITLNFPMNAWSKFLKGIIAVMIYVTHALNFWVPFSHCFYYIGKRVRQDRVVFWELVFRAIFVILIGLIAITFPEITALMGFLGAFCLSNMAFIWPNLIYLLVHYERPGLGKYKWRLWRGGILICIGIFLFFAGSTINTIELIKVFIAINT